MKIYDLMSICHYLEAQMLRKSASKEIFGHITNFDNRGNCHPHYGDNTFFSLSRTGTARLLPRPAKKEKQEEFLKRCGKWSFSHVYQYASHTFA